MSRRGAASVEFALLLPVLVTILGSTIDLGWYLWRHTAVFNVAAEGASAGGDVVRGAEGGIPTDEDIESAAVAQAEAVLEARGMVCGDGCVIDALRFADPATGYRYLRTRVEYPFEPVVGLLLPLSGPVTAEFTVMTLAQD